VLFEFNRMTDILLERARTPDVTETRVSRASDRCPHRASR
jgi:hypothetical protein